MHEQGDNTNCNDATATMSWPDSLESPHMWPRMISRLVKVDVGLFDAASACLTSAISMFCGVVRQHFG